MKRRFPYEVAAKVAQELRQALEHYCRRFIVAGSFRRHKPDVGDLEILYITKTCVKQDPKDMFAALTINVADAEIAWLEAEGVLKRRLNALGREVFGPKNKLMVHAATGLPVDLFAATEENWWNYLVCRTGPAENNVRIAAAARAMGWKWNPYGPGFTRLEPRPEGGNRAVMGSEREVFDFVGLPWLEPENR